MVIRWSEEDAAYLVTLPDLGTAKTHGATYEEAARNGAEVLELLMETWQEDGKPLPEPSTPTVAS